MLKNLPYALSAFALGALMDLITARVFALILGIIILAIGGGYLVTRRIAVVRKAERIQS